MMDSSQREYLVQEIIDCEVWLSEHFAEGGELDKWAKDMIAQQNAAESELEAAGYDIDGTEF